MESASFSKSDIFASNTSLSQIHELKNQLMAASRSQVIAEFTLDGKCITANENFLQAIGYSLTEIEGMHHRLFMGQGFHECAEYRMFWEKLGRGEFQQGQYRYVDKKGKDIWLEASYNAIPAIDGKPYKIVIYGTDITQKKMRSVDYATQISAINDALAIVEFDLAGNIINVNENFARVMGYTVSEMIGRHHRFLIHSSNLGAESYPQFWSKLAVGKSEPHHYKHVGNNGKCVWLEATYNPIFDLNGRPFKIVQHAIDVTKHIQAIENFIAALDETKHVIGAAKKGDLSKRIILKGKDKMLMDMCEEMNLFMDCIELALKDSLAYFHDALKLIAEIKTSSTQQNQLLDKLDTAITQAHEIIKNVAAKGADDSTESLQHQMNDGMQTTFQVNTHQEDNPAIASELVLINKLLKH